jgi:hypothetical protein
MAYFAFSDSTQTIRQVDTTNPSLLAYPVHIGEMNIHSLAITVDKEFALAWGHGLNAVRRTKGFNTDTPLYTPPANGPWAWKARVRNVGGAERVYFSGFKSDEPFVTAIYYLAGATPQLYMTIDIKKLPYPHPCDPSGTEAYAWSGDFVFDSDNTLYLSSGNQANAQVGIYRITGAGPDTITGNVERIYLGEGPIEALCYESPQTLYFLHEAEIWKLDLSTMMATLEGHILPSEHTTQWDITYMKDGFSPPWWWAVVSFIVNGFSRAASAISGWGERLAVAATPPSRPPVG